MYDLARRLEEAGRHAAGPKGIYPNVDFYQASFYPQARASRDLFTPIFAIARVAGWLAHWKEQWCQSWIYRPPRLYRSFRQEAGVAPGCPKMPRVAVNCMTGSRFGSLTRGDDEKKNPPPRGRPGGP